MSAPPSSAVCEAVAALAGIACAEREKRTFAASASTAAVAFLPLLPVTLRAALAPWELLSESTVSCGAQEHFMSPGPSPPSHLHLTSFCVRLSQAQWSFLGSPYREQSQW